MNVLDAVQENKAAHKAYREETRKAEELLTKIHRAMIEMPAAGTWALVGDMQYLNRQLQEISDRLCGEGEYGS